MKTTPSAPSDLTAYQLRLAIAYQSALRAGFSGLAEALLAELRADRAK
jgi:hypothetical protein